MDDALAALGAVPVATSSDASPEYLAAIAPLGEPTVPEQLLIGEVVKVDLSHNSGTKWDRVARLLATILDDDEALKVGGGGLADRSKLNQTSNRMKQAGVADVDVTIFVVGEVACLASAENGLKEVIANPSTRLREACLILRDGQSDRARIYKIFRQEGA